MTHDAGRGHDTDFASGWEEGRYAFEERIRAAERADTGGAEQRGGGDDVSCVAGPGAARGYRRGGMGGIADQAGPGSEGIDKGLYAAL